MELNHRCQDMIPVLEFDIYDVNNPLHR
jgi:hypothetical protein